MFTFHITTLGCKVNQYESRAVAAKLRRLGLEEVSRDSSTDVLIINTCCITTNAMRKSRNAITQLVKRSPNAFVLVMGCYSDYDKQKISQIIQNTGTPQKQISISAHHGDPAKQLDNIIIALNNAKDSANDNDEKSICDESHAETNPRDKLAGESSKQLGKKPSLNNIIKANRLRSIKENPPGTQSFKPIDRFDGRQRAFVKIQDGCDAFCSYCIIPFTRSRLWSRPVDEILDECKTLVNSGHREIVLCGVFLGAFNQKTTRRDSWLNDPHALPKLLNEVANIDNLWKVRLSSLAPGDVTTSLLDVFANNNTVAPHLHIPLQSGSETILKRMNRQYTPDDFRRTVDKIRSTITLPAITTDIIVGFPGETDDDFAKTLSLAKFAGFSKIHAFPFSPIEPTAAWLRRSEIPHDDIVRERIKILADLESQLAQAYHEQFVGETVQAIVENSKNINQTHKAMTDRYLTVQFNYSGKKNLTGKIINLNINQADESTLFGNIKSI